MFKSDSGKRELNGFLGAGSHMKGDLHFEDTFRIDGKLTGGAISRKGELIVGESGEVDGEIQVHEVCVSGTAKGTLRASKSVEITSSGRVWADVLTPSLVVEEGAFFEGRCSMQGQGRGRGDGEGKVTPMPLARPTRG